MTTNETVMTWPPPLVRNFAANTSEDWRPVEYAEVSADAAGHYNAADWMILGAALGQPFRTPFAFYRVADDAGRPPDDWSWRMFYAGRLASAIVDARAEGRRKGSTDAIRKAWIVLDMLAAYGSGIAPDKAIAAAKRAGLDTLAAELGGLSEAMSTRERAAHAAEVEAAIPAMLDHFA